MDEELFKISEVAERLKVTEAAVRKWIAQKKLAVVYVGSDRRVTKAAVDAFMEASAQAAAKRRRVADDDTIDDNRRTTGHAAGLLQTA